MSPDPAHFLESPQLRAAGFRHGFFTRKGGVSTGPYASLNFSYGVGDDSSRVGQNLELAAAALGIPPQRLYYLTQVHGRGVEYVEGTEPVDAVRQRPGDALLSRSPGIACGVRVADCVPILLGCPATGYAAAVHAGWRGVAANIAGATVGRLQQLGCRPSSLVAAIGPHISSAAFEVGDDVATELLRVAGDPHVIDRSRGSKPHVDLRAIVRGQLERAGLHGLRIDDVLGCTMSDGELFFSYRRDGRASGRHLAAIVPLGV